MLVHSKEGWSLVRPVTNRQGATLLGFVAPDHVNSRQHQPITAALVALRVQGRYVVGFNRSRNRWELPAGGIEWGETPQQCAIRELQEEACQRVTRLIDLGLAHAKRSTGFKKYTAVFAQEIDSLLPFTANNEWSRLQTWDLRNAPLLDPLDRAVLTYVDLHLGGTTQTA